VLISTAYAGLPLVGEAYFTGTKFRTATVLALYQNFVELDALQPADASETTPIPVKSGTTFNIVLPPLDDRVTSVRVLAVGEIRGRVETSTRYRAAIVQRKFVDTSSWGALETIDVYT
jgi:hypothetical protein